MLGVFGGIGVSRLILFLFNQAGAGFPDTETILKPRTFIAAAVVGLGVTLLSVFVPARRASTIPPVAAMRPELGFEALKKKQLIIGAIVAAVGVVMLIIGLFVQPGPALSWAALAGASARWLSSSVSPACRRPSLLR